MLALPNPFYKNPEANARQLLQQQMMMDTQKSIQQSLMELLALRSLFSQGQIFFCVPIGGPVVPPGIPPLPQVPQPNFPWPQEKQEASPPETKLRLSVKGDRERRSAPQKQGECTFRADSVEIVLDLRCVLPAEVAVEVGERSIRVDATRVDKEGAKSSWWLYELPACILADLTKCVISHDGFLHISVPWYRMEQ